MDAWTREVVDPIAEAFGAAVVYPFAGPPYLPFQRWAARAEPLAVSPLRIFIHPVYGLWHAFRAALLFRQSIALAVAVGDGIDVGVVVSYPFVQMAAEALSQVRAHAAELGSRSLVKLLHLDRFVSPLVSVAVPQSKKRLTPELHLAYRLPGYELDDLLRRVSQLMSLLQGRESGKEGERAIPQPAEPVRK